MHFTGKVHTKIIRHTIHYTLFQCQCKWINFITMYSIKTTVIMIHVTQCRKAQCTQTVPLLGGPNSFKVFLSTSFQFAVIWIFITVFVWATQTYIKKTHKEFQWMLQWQQRGLTTFKDWLTLMACNKCTVILGYCTRNG